MAGRKPAYDEQELLDALLATAKKYPEKKMTPALLARETDFPRHAWTLKTYQKVQAAIKRLNRVKGADAVVEKAAAIAGNLGADIIAAKGNAKKLNKIVNEYAKTMEQMRKILNSEKKKTEEFQAQCEELKKQLAKEKEEAAYYRKQWDNVFVASADMIQRQRQGLKKDVSDKMQRGNTAVLDISDEAFAKAFNDFLK